MLLLTGKLSMTIGVLQYCLSFVFRTYAFQKGIKLAAGQSVFQIAVCSARISFVFIAEESLKQKSTQKLYNYTFILLE